MLGPFVLGLFVFTFVFLITQLFRVLEVLLNSGVPALLALELILSLLPGIISITMPMALLVAILLAYGRLSADREILAIRMSGVNLMHICVPAIGLGVVLSVLMIAANHRLVPFLNLKSSDLAMQIEYNIISGIGPNRFYDLDSGRKAGGISSIFFYDHRDPETGHMGGVNIKTRMEPEESDEYKTRRKQLRDRLEALDRKDPKYGEKLQALREGIRKLEASQTANEFLITAARGVIDANMEDRLITVELTSGSIHMINPAEESGLGLVRFDAFTKSIRPRFSTTDDGYYAKSPREMSMPDLRRTMGLERRLERLALVEYYQRISIPLACLAFALIAMPLGVYARPTGKAVAFGISFLLILLYYGLTNYGVSLGRTGSSIAPFAILFPNILLSLVGSFLLYRMVMK